MPSYNPKTFTQPESLKKMDPKILRSLFEKFSAFFLTNGLDLQAIPPDQELPYAEIARMLTTPEDAPELGGALYLIDELASEKWFDELQETAERLEIPGLSQDLATADLATLVWLRDPAVAQRLHASTYLSRQRSFGYFHCEEVDDKWPGPTQEEIEEMERDLTKWFLSNKRGEGCRVFHFFRENEHWFLVWHGQPFRREGSVVEGEPGSVVYRPEKYDVLGFKPEDGSVKIHAGSTKDAKNYRDLLSELLLPEGETFQVTDRYSLDPLKTMGPEALHCTDVPDIAWIKLREIQYEWGGQQGEIEIRRARDIFAANQESGRTVPEKATIRCAKFGVAFRGGKRSRSVTLKPPNVVQYTRDPDSTPIEDWLRLRGFYSE